MPNTSLNSSINTLTRLVQFLPLAIELGASIVEAVQAAKQGNEVDAITKAQAEVAIAEFRKLAEANKSKFQAWLDSHPAQP